VSGDADRLHVVEPTLADDAGHCLSFSASLCAAADGRPVTLWVRRGALLPPFPPWVTVERHFGRRLRRLQGLLLYRRLLASPGRVLVATATHLDLLLLAWAAGGRPIPAGKVSLYVHWFRDSPSKRRTLRRQATGQPGLTVLAPTASVVDLFRSCGVPRVELVPYPITPLTAHAPGAPAAGPAGFRHVLFAGAPRQDKGFGRFVDLVATLARDPAPLPVALQRAAAGDGRYQEATRRDLGRLDALGYPRLATLPDPLPGAGYAAQFQGAVCVQPYVPAEFQDRVSGVTLDALSAGAPVVALAGTWSARAVARFGAGVVVSDAAGERLAAAVREAVARYPELSERARAAGLALHQEHDAGRLYRAVMAPVARAGSAAS
jgi:glycosyltransferase involved in cell wall biosynthesis